MMQKECFDSDINALQPVKEGKEQSYKNHTNTGCGCFQMNEDPNSMIIST